MTAVRSNRGTMRLIYKVTPQVVPDPRVSLGTVGVVGADPVKTVLLGSVENWHATD